MKAAMLLASGRDAKKSNVEKFLSHPLLCPMVASTATHSRPLDRMALDFSDLPDHPGVSRQLTNAEQKAR
jgi:hypothetical protein